MLNFDSVIHRAATAFAAFASLVLLAAPIERAFAGPPSMPVTVTNPATSPVPTTTTNPATNPALTSSVDDPGRVAYASTQSIPTTCAGVSFCSTINFPAVPTGHRLVVQHVSGSVFIGGTTTAFIISLFPSGSSSPPPPASLHQLF
jgi:hypothetical protein